MNDSSNWDDQLQKWLQFSQKIYSSMFLEQVTNTTLELSLELTDTQRACLFLVDREKRVLFRAGRNTEGETLDSEDFSTVFSLVQQALEKQEAIFFSGKEVAPSEIRSGFCIPLFSKQSASDDRRVVGILYQDIRGRFDFGEQHRETAAIIALHAGPALESSLLFELATRDAVSGVFLRHYFFAVAMVEWKRTVRHRHPVTILAIDVDQFKAINEKFGRERGDLVLRKTAEALKNACRAGDVIARFEGDQFMLLLPETTVTGAKRVAKRIQENMAGSVAIEGEPVTVSIGVSTYPRCVVNSMQDLIRLAETSLNQAKLAGKNRLVIYEPALLQAHTKLF